MASFLQALLRLTRVGNLLIFGIAQYGVAYFLVHPSILTDVRLLLLVISTLLVAAGGYVINDYYDIKIDYINKPDRVVVGKSIPRRFAILFHTLFSIAGVVVGFFAAWQMAVANFLAAFLLWWYSNSLKRLPLVGNLSVAFLTAASIYAVVIPFPTNKALVIVYALFAFFITLIREVIKDMEDLKGDITFGCKTLPIVWGFRKTKQFLYILIAFFCLMVWGAGRVYAVLPDLYFLFSLFVPCVVLIVYLYRADTVRDFTRLSTLCKAIMLLGILSMVLL